MTAPHPNRQIQKTRAALLEAFRDLVVVRRYADIRVADIIDRANVGRSTFYEHFRNKDDILQESVSAVLTPIADTVTEVCETERLRLVLEHIAENSRLARGLLNGPSAPQMVRVLARLVEDRLRDGAGAALLPLELAAAQIAEAQIGLLRVWLNQGMTCPAEKLAAALRATSVALTTAE